MLLGQSRLKCYSQYKLKSFMLKCGVSNKICTHAILSVSLLLHPQIMLTNVNYICSLQSCIVFKTIGKKHKWLFFTQVCWFLQLELICMFSKSLLVVN